MKRKRDSLDGLFANFNPKERGAFFKWEDDPFVVTVNVDQTQDGYLTEWWVSGLTKRDFHDQSPDGFPKLILKLQLGISRKESGIELEQSIHEIWFESVKELSFESAIQGGIQQPLGISSSTAIQDLHADFHLEGHDRLDHFESVDSDSPTTLRTAKQYGLLKSMRYPRTQQAIAEYESRKQAIEVLVGAIDRRLYMSRKSGLVKKKATNVPFFKSGNTWNL